MLLVGIQTAAGTVENIMDFPQKPKNGTAFWPRDPTAGNISKEMQNTNLKEYIHLYVHCGIIYNSQDLEAAQVPIGRWVDRKAVVKLHNRILCSCKKEVNPTFCNSMDGPGECYAKWSKPVRERLIHMISLICGI